MGKVLLLLIACFAQLVTVDCLHTQWVKTNGPNGADISCFAVSPNIASTIVFIAGTRAGGVYYTTNHLGFANWTFSSNGLLSHDIRALVQLPDYCANRLYVATLGGGVYVKTDYYDGPWTPINSGLTNRDVNALLVSGANFFAATNGGGVFRSTFTLPCPAQSASWNQVNTGLTDTNVLSLTSNGTSLFAGTEHGGVFRSSDNGLTWATVNNGLPATIPILTIAASGNIVLAGTQGSGIFRSTDAGTIWAEASGLPINTTVLRFSGITFAGTEGSGLFRSTDLGANWVSVSNGLGNLDATTVAFISGNYFVGTREGIYWTTNPGSGWIEASGNLKETSVENLSVDPNSLSNLFATTNAGLFLSTNSGSRWKPINAGLKHPCSSNLAFAGSSLFVGTWGFGVFKSTNNGTSWKPINAGLTSTRINALATMPNGGSSTILFAATHSGGAYRSLDSGTTWSAVNSGLPSAPIGALAICDTILFCAPQDHGVFRSTNKGASWNAAGLTNQSVLAFAVKGTNLYAGLNGDWIYRTTNYGENWTRLSGGFGGIYIMSFAANERSIFAGSWDGFGICLSTNDGASWNTVNTGLGNIPIMSLAISGTNLFAGTYGDGVWRRQLSEMTSVERLPTELPTHFSLAQNYPNPFNPATKILFSLPSKAIVSLKVFDALGRQVAELLNEQVTAGAYSTEWNATGFASGVYYYQLRAGDFVQTKKLVLLK